MQQEHLISVAGKAGRLWHALPSVVYTAQQAVRVLPVLFVVGWVAVGASGFVKDRLEDLQNELPEYRQRRRLVRMFRHSLSGQDRRMWARNRLLGHDVRTLFEPAYSGILERLIRAAMPQGPTVWRREVIWVQPLDEGAGWKHMSALLDPFTDGMGLRMTQQMAANLGTHPGQSLNYSIGGHEFSGPVAVQALPDMAAAIQLARRDATAANQQLNQGQLERRAAEIIAERKRCVVVPAEVLRHLLRAGFNINMS